jgi:hypothetical protein
MRKQMFLVSVAIVALLILISPACGNGETTQSSSSVTFYIQVTDIAGNPLPGTKVVSETEPEGQLKITGLSDDAGNITFDNVKAGDYRLYISRFDYNPVEVAITVTSLNNELKIAMSLTSPTTPTPTTTPVPVTFNQLLIQPELFKDQFVIVEGSYFSGFEIAALSSGLTPASYNPANFAPVQPLIWITGNLGQTVYDGLLHQSNTLSGYTENFGKVRITGQFQYGSKYGHLNAYNYQIFVTGAELLPWD